jgi:ectoine hydroxylase-related dioxygenase (phytanoyl-CoA dioxygenase family)
MNERILIEARAGDAYRADGFSVFRQALDPRGVEELARLEENVVLPYPGPLLRHDGRVVSHDFYESAELSTLERSRSGLVNAHLLNDGPMRPFSEAFARLLSSSAIFDCLHSLDTEERYTLHQTIFFFVSPLTVPHIDRMTLDTHPLGHSFTVWIAIDPIDSNNGPVFVVPTPAGQYDSDHDLGVVHEGGTSASIMKAHREGVARKLKARGAMMVAPVLNPGDVLVFAPSTPHGSFPTRDAKLRRRAVQAIYRVTRFDRWGRYPEHGDRHDIAAEEDVVSESFNFLKVQM